MRNARRATDSKPRGRQCRVGSMPLALAVLLNVSVAPGLSPPDIGLILGGLHASSASSKSRRSLQLHAELRQKCAGAADKLMLNYRADVGKFHRQSKGDWAELLATASSICNHELLRYPTIRRSSADVVSGVGSLQVGAPDLANWSKACPELEPRATQRATNPFLGRRRSNDAVGVYTMARSAPACNDSTGVSTRRNPRDRGVEAQLRAMLQKAAKDHTWTVSHATMER
jgi:hypothetical protein